MPATERERWAEIRNEREMKRTIKITHFSFVGISRRLRKKKGIEEKFSSDFSVLVALLVLIVFGGSNMKETNVIKLHE